MEEGNKNNKLKEFFSLNEVFGYYFRKKRQEEGKADINLRMMHGINKIALFVFLLAVIIWIVKRIV